MLAELEARRTIRDTLLRISGAIRVIEELLSARDQEQGDSSTDPIEVAIAT